MKKKQILENTFYYSLSAVFVNGMNFLLMPLYTRILSPNDYGMINLITSFNSVAIFIVAFSLYSSVGRFYADYKDNVDKLKDFYGTIIIFVSISSTVFLVLSITLKHFLLAYVFKGLPFFPIVLISLFTIVFTSLHTLHQFILQGMQMGKKLTIINLVVFCLQVILNLVFLLLLHLDGIGILISTLLVNLSYSFFMIFDLKRSNLIRFHIDFRMLKEALAYSLPLLPHNLSTFIAKFVSRLFVSYNSSLASVGLFSVASQFGSIIDIVQVAVNRAFTPWFFQVMNSKEEKGQIKNLSQVLLLFYSFIFVVLSLFSHELVILFLDTRYHMSWTAIPVFIFAFSLKSIYYFYVNLLFYYKDATKKIFIISTSGSLVDILSAYFLIPRFGINGAAFSFLLSKIVIVFITVLVCMKYNSVGYNFKKMISVILLNMVVVFVGLYFSYTVFLLKINFLDVVYKSSIIIVYIVAIYMYNKKQFSALFPRFKKIYHL